METLYTSDNRTSLGPESPVHLCRAEEGDQKKKVIRRRRWSEEGGWKKVVGRRWSEEVWPLTPLLTRHRTCFHPLKLQLLRLNTPTLVINPIKHLVLNPQTIISSTPYKLKDNSKSQSTAYSNFWFNFMTSWRIQVVLSIHQRTPWWTRDLQPYSCTHT